MADETTTTTAAAENVGSAEPATPTPEAESLAGETPAPEPLTFDTWITDQPDPVRTMLDAHTAGLKSALDAERSQRRDFEKQIKTLAKQAEAGSELRSNLDALQAVVEAANRRAEYYEVATDPALGLRDARLAWTVISADPDKYYKNSKPDFDALKTDYPLLFEQPRTVARPTAGSGTASDPAPVKSTNQRMNDFLRGARG